MPPIEDNDYGEEYYTDECVFEIQTLSGHVDITRQRINGTAAEMKNGNNIRTCSMLNSCFDNAKLIDYLKLFTYETIASTDSGGNIQMKVVAGLLLALFISILGS